LRCRIAAFSVTLSNAEKLNQKSPLGRESQLIRQIRQRGQSAFGDRPSRKRLGLLEAIILKNHPHPSEAPQSASLVFLPNLPGVDCPCGVARRAFADIPQFHATVHLTQMMGNARRHYHRRQTEVYVIVSCEAGAAIELDGRLHSVSPMTAIHIPPGVRHRAIGEMTVLIYCTPKFDANDEFFD